MACPISAGSSNAGLQMIQIDLAGSEPIVDQIAASVREAIARGVLKPDDELPSTRQLGSDLGIHWNTVARAFRILADEGLLVVGRGRRTYVRSRGHRPASEAKPVRESIRASVREILTSARLAGLDADQVKKLVDDEMRRWART